MARMRTLKAGKRKFVFRNLEAFDLCEVIVAAGYKCYPRKTKGGYSVKTNASYGVVSRAISRIR